MTAIERLWEMPNTDTFKMKKLRMWILKFLMGRVLNAFGGNTRLDEYNGEIVHNDINPKVDADTYYDALFIDKYFEPKSFDTIILDPPYSIFQAVHYYDDFRCQDITRVRNAVDKLLKNGGFVISLGWNSTGMGKKRGYEKLAILLVSCGGSHNDFIVTVERKMNGVLKKS